MYRRVVIESLLVSSSGEHLACVAKMHTHRIPSCRKILYTYFAIDFLATRWQHKATFTITLCYIVHLSAMHDARAVMACDDANVKQANYYFSFVSLLFLYFSFSPFNHGKINCDNSSDRRACRLE